MGRSKFIKGAEGTLNGKQITFLRVVGNDYWQLEDNTTGELTRIHQKALLTDYLEGNFRFHVPPPSGRSNRSDIRRENATKEFQKLPETIRHRAMHRRHYVKALEELGPTPTRAIAENAISTIWKTLQWPPKKAPNYTSVWRWQKRYGNAGKDIRSIVDRYHHSGNFTRRLPQALIEIIETSVNQVYMAEERKTIQDTLDHAISEVTRENMLRVASEQLPLPRLRQIKEVIQKIPEFDRYAARHGARAANVHFRSVLQKPQTDGALQRVEIDHTRLDIFVVDEETMLPLGRPWLTLCIDSHTRCVMGFDLSFDPPSHMTVARCLRHALLPKGDIKALYPSVKGSWDMYGVMETLVCDNGPEFHGGSLEFACLNLGIGLQYCPRKQPWFKGKVERFLGTLNRGVAHGNPGTTFSNIFEKEDYDSLAKATVTLSTLREIIHVWIVDYYHQRPHKGIGDLPAHAWLVETVGKDIEVPTDLEEFKAILGKVETRYLTHTGIKQNKLFYNSEALSEVRRRLGQIKVDIRVHEDDLGYIHVLVPDTNTFLAVPCIDQEYAQGITLWQHKICQRYAKRELEGRTDIVALAEAKRAIRDLIEKDFFRKRKQARTRVGRARQFTERPATPIASTSEQVPIAVPALAPENIATPTGKASRLSVIFEDRTKTTNNDLEDGK